MIASKGQLVRLIGRPTEVAKVLSIVYRHLPEGERGVQLDKELDGSKWHVENMVEDAQSAPTSASIPQSTQPNA